MLTGSDDACSAMEECYEQMLAYAAEGLPTDQGSPSGTRLRDSLVRAAATLAGLIAASSSARELPGVHPFVDVLRRDARRSLAAIDLVLAQPSISSQLIDNLNASIHLRALLTDLFLVSELAKTAAPAEQLTR